MKIDTKIQDNTIYIMLSGELDEYTSHYTRTYLDDTFESKNYESVIFDMQNLEFMDSTGIGVLLGRYKKLKSKKKSAYILNSNKSIDKILTMSGIYEIMPKIS